MKIKKFSELKSRFMRIKRRQAATAVMAVLTVLLIVAAVLEFFMVIRVTNIVVKGESPYKAEEIIEFSEVKKRDFSYSFDKDEVEARILESAPYLREVKVSRVYTRLVIKVEADSAKYYLKISDKSNEYFILSEDLRVLESRNNIATIKEEGLVYLELPQMAICSVGKHIEYTEPEKCGYVEENLEYFFEKEYADTITAINLKSRFDNCYVDFYGKCRVVFGKPENLDEKMLRAMEILKRFSDGENGQYVLIDVSDPNQAVYSNPESLD